MYCRLQYRQGPSEEDCIIELVDRPFPFIEKKNLSSSQICVAVTQQSPRGEVRPPQHTMAISRITTFFYKIFPILLLPLCHGSERFDSRYSFSLTTFDPTGKLGQVERAVQAASLGTPVVALCRPDGILMAAPQAVPSPLIRDDGTPRFTRVSRDIMISHSGLGADGRVLAAAAQRLAVEHAYTFDEAIPIELFLEEIALLFQEFTMKPASRPFGCSLIVAHVPETENNNNDVLQPELYCIDPSGSVESVTTSVVIGGLMGSHSLELKEAVDKEIKFVTNKNSQYRLVDLMREVLQKNSLRHSHDGRSCQSLTVLTAALVPGKDMIMRRHNGDSSMIDRASTKEGETVE